MTQIGDLIHHDGRPHVVTERYVVDRPAFLSDRELAELKKSGKDVPRVGYVVLTVEAVK